jgi:predicted nucleotide-binding protein (sugar kinase/HSP70/actin superfamily)
MIDVEKTIDSARHLLSVHFRGEGILTVGLALREILHESCGVISIGPFGCMPARVSEAILKKEMTPEGKARLPGWSHKAHEFDETGPFPFLALETDGSPFPQLIEANLEAFVLQARRLHEKMKQVEKHREHSHKRNLPILLLDMFKGSKKRPVISG